MKLEISVNGDLQEVCSAIGEKFKLDAAQLFAYSQTAPNVLHEGEQWPIGSIFPNEHRLLYGLIALLKPRHVVEAGTYTGCSTTAILSALELNLSGKLVSFDKDPDAGNRIPNVLKSRWQFHCATAEQGLAEYAPFRPIDFFFEDTQHTRESTRDIFKAALPHMASGGYMMAHDPVSRPDVLLGLKDVGIDTEVYLLEGSNCGVTLWQNP